MKNFIQILLLAIVVCIDDCSLEIGERKSSRDVTDYDLQEMDYNSFPAKSQNMGPPENEYRKLGLSSDNINGDHKSAYGSQRNKFHMRHSRNGKINRKRRTQDAENLIFEYPEHRNRLQSNFQEPKRQRLDNAGEPNFKSSIAEGMDIDKHFPFKKHTTVKRWPVRRLKKFHGLKEMPINEKTEYRQGVNDEDSSDYNDSDSEDKSKDVSKPSSGSYVLVPEKNQLIKLKNLKTKLENERFNYNGKAEKTDQSPDMTMKSDFAQLDDVLNEVITTEEPSCKTQTEKSDVESNDESSARESEDNLKSKLKQEILNCTTAGLDKYLKLFGKNNDNSEQDKSDLMNLNISINGLVMNNDKPSKICGNGTIKVNPGYDEERKRRALKIPFMKKFSNQKEAVEEEAEEAEEAEDETEKVGCKKGSNESKQKEEKKCEDVSNPDAGLTPDKLSNEIVKMVSHMVRSNPKMKTLWPSLKRNRPSNKGAACNLRTTANCSGRKQIEDMLRKAMASVNDIIEKEIQSRSCVPLSEDLAEFYEVILEMHAKQAKRKEEREEMLIQAEKLDKEPIDSDEKPKKKTCKAKPKRYEQDTDSQDDELFDMMHLRKLQYDREIADERRRREAEKRTHELILDTANSSLVRKLRQMYSPAFLKLNSAVESVQRSEMLPESL